jgi:hypothetical protein
MYRQVIVSAWITAKKLYVRIWTIPPKLFYILTFINGIWEAILGIVHQSNIVR